MSKSFKEIINQYVILIQQKMNTDEMIFLKKFHLEEYNQKMASFVPAFSEEYPQLYKMIISGADISILNLFLDNIDAIDSGEKTLNDARSDLGHMLHDKYVKK